MISLIKENKKNIIILLFSNERTTRTPEVHDIILTSVILKLKGGDHLIMSYLNTKKIL
jgi:hypothetical protein